MNLCLLDLQLYSPGWFGRVKSYPYEKLRKSPFIFWSFNCKNYPNVSVKLLFIPASALVGMHSTHIGQLMPSAAAPLILCMRACIGECGLYVILSVPCITFCLPFFAHLHCTYENDSIIETIWFIVFLLLSNYNTFPRDINIYCIQFLIHAERKLP